MYPDVTQRQVAHAELSADAGRCAGSKVKRSPLHSRSKSRMEEARDILANIILCHVPVVRYQFHAKVRPACCCGRSVTCLPEPAVASQRTAWQTLQLWQHPLRQLHLLVLCGVKASSRQAG